MKISGKKKNGCAILSWDDFVIKDQNGNDIEDVIEVHMNIVSGEIPHVEIIKITNFETQEKVKIEYPINSLSINCLNDGIAGEKYYLCDHKFLSKRVNKQK